MSATQALAAYTFERFSSGADEEWDDFLRSAPGGSYRQSTAWADVKSLQGWQVERLVVRRGDRIVAGAQLLVRPLPAVPSLGWIASCPKGPLMSEDDPVLADEIVERLRGHCRARRIQVLIVQPPEDGLPLESTLQDAGYVESPVPVAPRATALVDLTPGVELIEQRLGKNLRKQLRRAERRGLRVRSGGAADVATFHALLTRASERLDYRLPQASYYRRLWEVFSAGDRAQLLLVEHEGEPVSAGLCLVFGQRAISTAVGWSGELGHLNPNDLLDWHTIRWAKARGLRQLELENLSYDLARQLVAGADPAQLDPQGSDRYKLKWSTDVVVCPRPYLTVPHPSARALLRHMPDRVTQPSLQLLAKRFRPLATD